MSLVELLIVISVFAILGVVVTSILTLTLRGSQKAESTIKVREDMNYAFSVIERNLRNAQEIDCDNSDIDTLTYLSHDGFSSSFSCTVGTDGFVSSGSARLTKNEVSIVFCEFSCIPSSSIIEPPVINVSLIAEDKESKSPTKSQVDITTQIVARNY